MTLDGTFERSFGTRGSGNGEFNQPWGMAVSGGRLFVADHWNHRVQVFS